jgi:oligopeptide/dipeptide ABC transporter ATP-binding protein
MSKYFEIKNLVVKHRTYEGERTVLSIDSISVEKGGTYGVVGESGAGKTVLALTIQKLLSVPPGFIESGEIWLDGENLLEKSEMEMRRIRGNKIAMIFQDPMSTLNPVFTIGFQMVNVIRKNQNLGKKEAVAKAIEMIETVKLPDPHEIMNKYPHELSGGQRQRIIIAMALSCGAELIIADEPTRNLDVTIQAGILKLIDELRESLNITVLYIANNLGLVSATCERMGVLKEGVIVEQGEVSDILQNPQHEYTKVLLGAITPNKSRKREGEVRNAEPLLAVRNLKKYFPVKSEFKKTKGLTVKAVDDVGFTLNKGEILGVVGESGCGKSTLVNTILFLHPPTEGTVLFDGEDVFSLSKAELRRSRKYVQIVFQDPFWSLNPRSLVRDIVGEPLKVHEKLTADGYLERVQDMLVTVGLSPDDAFKYPHEFSGGQRQRIAIARALSVNPKLLVLDEPTSAIDVVSQAQVLSMLDGLKEKMQLTYIMISHDLSVVNYMSDRIIVMYLGKIVEYGKSQEVFSDPKHPYTAALFNAIPKPDTRSTKDLSIIKGEIPSAINPPEGCRFHPRCEKCMDICRTADPKPADVGGRMVTCHLYSDREEMKYESISECRDHAI